MISEYFSIWEFFEFFVQIYSLKALQIKIKVLYGKIGSLIITFEFIWNAMFYLTYTCMKLRHFKYSIIVHVIIYRDLD